MTETTEPLSSIKRTIKSRFYELVMAARPLLCGVTQIKGFIQKADDVLELNPDGVNKKEVAVLL
jgi:hypothetical protein